jgi:hypothetical protein
MNKRQRQEGGLQHEEGDGEQVVAVQGDDDGEASSPSSTVATSAEHIEALQRIEDEYRQLTSIEENLTLALSRLRDEETSLRLAHEQSSLSLREQREMISKRKEDEAAKRLEEALLMMDDGDDSEDSDQGRQAPVGHRDE